MEVDAWNLYEENRLVCQPCLVKEKGGASGSISFFEESKWYKRFWKIDLGEWLETYECLPVNTECAREWVKNKQHLESCNCLEIEAKEVYELFSNSLKNIEAKLVKCACEKSQKVRVSSDYFAWCEKCETGISATSKKRVIKNRNDPKFWGLNIPQKVLCGNCLEEKKSHEPSLMNIRSWGDCKI